MCKGPEARKTLGHSQNGQWGHSMEDEKKGAVNEVGEGVKARPCGADKAMMNTVRISEFIPRALGGHWRVSSKRERERFDSSFRRISLAVM